ncbi:uncharacterized protein TNCV_1163201 [Trichonephila clavipes]|nr:uncharacterized protein TNCV_1163201 [Trichonephila clavipes]
MHGQCPSGFDTWCKYQKAKQKGKLYKHRTAGLPNAVLNTVKTTYVDLCDESLLEKCLHGKTQNANESFNGVLWSIILKETFVELLTLQFGSFLAVLQFNDGSKGILSALEYLHIPMGSFILKGFSKVDDERIVDSERHSLPITKNKRNNSEDLKKGTVHYLRKRKAVKSSITSSSTLTDENITTKIECPPLKLLQPASSISKQNKTESIPTVSTSPASTQAHLLPSTSATSKSQPPIPKIPVSNDVSSTNHNKITPIESSAIISTFPTSSSVPPSTTACTKQNSKARSRKRKKNYLKN